MHVISHLTLSGRAQLQKAIMFERPFDGTLQRSPVTSFKSVTIAVF